MGQYILYCPYSINRKSIVLTCGSFKFIAANLNISSSKLTPKIVSIARYPTPIIRLVRLHRRQNTIDVLLALYITLVSLQGR